MDALMHVAKAAAAESIMLSESPMTLSQLVVNVKAKLDRKDLMQCVVLGESLRASTMGASLPVSGDVANGVDISLTKIISALMLRDAQFCISEAGYCLYPCRPSVMARCEEVNTLFASSLYPSSHTRDFPFFQYRRCFGALAKAAVDHLTASMQPLIGRQALVVPGVHTSPSFSSWLQRWESTLTRNPNRGATFNSLHHQFRHSRRVDWNREAVRPIANGIITSPISVRSLELLLNYQAIASQRRRMPFRQWLMMGLVPEDAWLERASKEYSIGLAQFRAARVDAEGHSTHRVKFPSSMKSMRQFSPRMYSRCIAAATEGSSLDRNWQWNLDALRGVKLGQIAPAEVCAFPKLLPSASGEAPVLSETTELMLSDLEDEDVMVFHGSRAAFSTTILPIVEALDKLHDRLALREEGSQRRQHRTTSLVAPTRSINVADVARAALWTHEYGPERAHTWMTQYLRRFPQFLTVAKDGQTVCLVRH